jgi:nicotinamide phosphoribosyltransferase
MNFNWLEIYWTDTYKVGHKPMLPVGSTLMVSNFTPRSGKNSNCPNGNKIVSFGQQMLVRKIKEDWDINFFNKPISSIDQFAEDMGNLLMWDHPIDVSHFKALHELDYLPIEIRAIEEGTLIPYKVPFYTIVNTQPLNGVIFDWIVNYLETILSAESWQAPTAATTAYCLRKLGQKWIAQTDPENAWFVDYQFHNFSMRGMDGKSSIVNSGLGFATCSRGSDTLPVIPAARKYYDEPLDRVPINSVIASEHAVMCSLTGFFLYTKGGSWERIGQLEIETFRYLLQTFPTGILSLVSDTWDLWRVICEYCVELKEEILAREGKLVIRPDSGDPVEIVCGADIRDISKDKYCPKNDIDGAKQHMKELVSNRVVAETPHGECGDYKPSGIFKYEDKYYEITLKLEWNRYDKQYYYIDDTTIIKFEEIQLTPQQKGVIELLWEIFGGDVSSTDYKRLNPKIGAIYGDSITYKRAEQIFERLAAKGFASTNIVLGVGSYSLQYVTRDTHGFAQKATYVEIEFEAQEDMQCQGGPMRGEMFIQGIEIFKDPITDSGIKKSAKGLLVVHKDENGEYILKDQATWNEVNSPDNQLKTIFKDGEFYNETTLTAIREKLAAL